MAEIYNMISIIAFSIAGVSFVLALIFWFRFDIWKTIGELSGRTAKKTIAKMRLDNEQSSEKAKEDTSFYETGKENRQWEEPTSGTTEKLSDGQSTTMLNYNAAGSTEILNGGTEILSHGKQDLSSEDKDLPEGTEVLTETMVNQDSTIEVDGFELIQNIILIHTNEII